MSETHPRIELNEYNYFDPPNPELPETVFGFDTDQVMQVVTTLGEVAVQVPYNKRTDQVTKGLSVAKWYIKDIVRVMPLLERVNEGDELKPEDVRPYRRPIKRLIKKGQYWYGSQIEDATYQKTFDEVLERDGPDAAANVRMKKLPNFARIDRWSKFIPPLRRKLNQRVEQEFIDRAPGMMEVARQAITGAMEQAEPYLQTLEQFENPREQVRREIGEVNQEIRHNVMNQAIGLPTAEDWGRGVGKTVHEQQANPWPLVERMPLTRGLATTEAIEAVTKAKTDKISWDKLGIVAPEISRGLDRLSLPEQRDHQMVQWVRSAPHPQRRLAERFAGRKIDDVRRTFDRTAPNVLQLIPESPAKLREFLEKIRQNLRIN